MDRVLRDAGRAMFRRGVRSIGAGGRRARRRGAAVAAGALVAYGAGLVALGGVTGSAVACYLGAGPLVAAVAMGAAESRRGR